MLTLQGREVQVWTPDGRLLSTHPVGIVTGRFGEGADGTVWLASKKSLTAFRLSEAGVESTSRHAGTWPVGCDEERFVYHREHALHRIQRSDDSDLDPVKNPLRKGAKARLDHLSADGRVGVFVDVQRSQVIRLDVDSGKKQKKDAESLDLTKVAYARSDPDARRFALPTPASVTIVDLQEPAVVASVELGMDVSEIAASAAGFVVATSGGSNRTIRFVTWDGEASAPWDEARQTDCWSVMALSADGARVFCDGPRGPGLRDAKTGEELRPAAGPEAAGEAGFSGIRLPSGLGRIVDVARAGDHLVLELAEEVQLRSPDGAELLVSTPVDRTQEAVHASGAELWKWSGGGLEVISASGAERLMKPEILTNASGADDRVLVLAKNHDGPVGVVYDTATRAPTPVKMRPSKAREHVWLSPDGSYAVGWENGRELTIHSSLGARANVRFEHERYGVQLLRFSASGARFAYVMTGGYVRVWRSDGDAPEAAHDTIDGARPRCVAFDGETLWIAAGDGLYRLDGDEADKRAEPGPVTRFIVDGERLLCVLRDGLVAIEK